MINGTKLLIPLGDRVLELAVVNDEQWTSVVIHKNRSRIKCGHESLPMILKRFHAMLNDKHEYATRFPFSKDNVEWLMTTSEPQHHFYFHIRNNGGEIYVLRDNLSTLVLLDKLTVPGEMIPEYKKLAKNLGFKEGK